MISLVFVDDDDHVLSGLRRMVLRQQRDWKVRCALSGPAALQLLAEEPAHIVVSDMRMPGVDGAAFLDAVRSSYPTVHRVVLTGQCDDLAALRSASVAHVLVSKPCSPDRLVEVITRAGELSQRLAEPSLQHAVGRVGTLPSPPHVVRVLNEILDRADPDPDAVAAAVDTDVAITAKLLQLVNSAFFGVGTRVEDARGAVRYLGVNVVRDLAACVAVFRAFQGDAGRGAAIDALQAHSVDVAAAAARLVDARDRPSAFSAGMLHDVGKLVIACELPDAAATIAARGPDCTELDAERATLGTTHAEIGAHLLELWGLPYEIVEAVGRHHDAPELPDRQLDLVHATYVADALVHGRTTPDLDAAYLDALGLTVDDSGMPMIAGAAG